MEPEHITCPCCKNIYSQFDEPLEHARVSAYQVAQIAKLEAMQDKLREVMDWLRSGASGKALEAAEKGYSQATGIIQ